MHFKRVIPCMDVDAGPATGPVASGPDPGVELAKYAPSQGNQKLPDVVGQDGNPTTWTVTFSSFALASRCFNWSRITAGPPAVRARTASSMITRTWAARSEP